MPDLHSLIRAYLQAFEGRDLARCLDFFAEDATLRFAMATYRGTPAIEEWHRERFAADLRVTRIDEIRALDDKVVVDAEVTSNVIRAFRFESVAGTVTFRFQAGKIKEATFGLRMGLSLEGWWSSRGPS